MEGPQGSLGLEIRVDFDARGLTFLYCHLVDLTIGSLHQAHSISQSQSSQVPATTDVPGQTLKVEMDSVPGNLGRWGRGRQLLDEFLAGFDGSKPRTCQE